MKKIFIFFLFYIYMKAVEIKLLSDIFIIIANKPFNIVDKK